MLSNPIVSMHGPLMQPMFALQVFAVLSGVMQPVLPTQPMRYSTNRGVASVRTAPNWTNRPIAN